VNDVDVVRDLEVELLSPAARRSPERLGQLLDADFREIGASGRVWSRAETIELLAGEDRTEPTPHAKLTGEVLAPGVVLLTYVSDPTGRRARRSSLWRRTPDGWKLRHHQGTLC
jgi:hypothetical protein